MVGEVRLPQHKQARKVAHQVIVDPQTTHRVVHGGKNPHGRLVGILPGDLVVHVKKVRIPLLHRLLPEPTDRLGEIQIHPEARLAHPPALVTHPLRRPGGDIPRRQVAVARIEPLQEIVTLPFRNLRRGAPVPLLLGYPDATVIAERFGHQRELGLVIPRDRDAGRVDLGETGVGKERPPPVGPPDRRGVRPAGIGGKVVGVAITAGAKQHRIRRMGLQLPRDQVPRDDSLRFAFGDHQIEHLVPGKHLHPPLPDLPAESRVGAQQQLLAGGSPRVKGAGDLSPAEGAVGKHPAVFPGKGNPLGHALVDDVHADLGQPVDVCLAGAEIPALDGVMKKTPDAVAVVLVILGGVDPSLGRDGMRAARAVMETERLHPVAQFGERGGRRGPGQPGTDHDHLVLPLVGGVHQPDGGLEVFPLVGQRAGRNAGVQFHVFQTPSNTASGIELKPRKSTTARIQEPASIALASLRSRIPRVWQRLAAPCRR